MLPTNPSCDVPEIREHPLFSFSRIESTVAIQMNGVVIEISRDRFLNLVKNTHAILMPRTQLAQHDNPSGGNVKSSTQGSGKALHGVIGVSLNRPKSIGSSG